jgi:hypothetical protein
MSTRTKIRCRVVMVEVEGVDPAVAVEMLAALAGLAPAPRLPSAPRRPRRAKKKPARET